MTSAFKLQLPKFFKKNELCGFLNAKYYIFNNFTHGMDFVRTTDNYYCLYRNTVHMDTQQDPVVNRSA